MKFRRRLLAFVLSATMIFSTATIAYAAYNAKYECATIYSKELDLSLYGYLDVLEGDLTFRDKYYYRGVLSGSDIWDFPSQSDKIYLKIYDDEGDCIKTVKLYKDFRSVSDYKTYGWGSDYGKLEMKCYDTTKTIKAVAN